MAAIEMRLEDFVGQIVGFDDLPPREKIRLFAWHLHVHKAMEHFGFADIRSCYKELHIVPDDVAKYVNRMTEADPPDVVRERNGFKLARIIRGQLDKKYGEHKSVIAVKALLAALPGKIPDIAEKTFLVETLNCYKMEAYRACIVMMWNLAYSHVLHWILADAARLASFNATIPINYPRLKNIQVAKYDDFTDELKERQVIEICNTAGLINSTTIKTLREKLDRRNTAAHPSTSVILQPQADDMVTDLVHNVVLALT